MSTDAAVAWLREQVQARRVKAEAATPGPWSASQEDILSLSGDPHWAGACAANASGDDATHIALNDPRDVIARCEAELAAIDLFQRVISDDAPHEYWSDGWAGLAVARLGLSFIASGYRHHAGYAEHWGSRVST